MAGAYLPPVVTELTANIDDVLRKIAEVKAAIKGIGGTDIPIKFDVEGANALDAILRELRDQSAIMIYMSEQMSEAMRRDSDNADLLAYSLQNVEAAGGGVIKMFTRAARATTDAGAAATSTIPIWHRWVDLFHFLFATFGENLVADSIGIAAFAISAVANFGPVIEAVNNLGQTYGYMNKQQQAAADSLTALKNQVAGAVNTGVFAVYYQLLGLVNDFLGRNSGITQQATHAFEYFAAALRQAFGDPAWAAVFSRSSGLIQQDLTALANLLISFIQLIPGLLHDFNGLGLGVLGAVTSLFRLVGAISEADPGLTRFAYAAYLAYRAWRYLWVGMGTGPGPIKALVDGIGTLTNKLAAARDAFAAEGLAAGAAELGIVGATLAWGAGIIAAGAFALAIDRINAATGQFRNPADALIAELRQQTQATGDNVEGYLRLADSLDYYGQHVAQVIGINNELASRLSGTSAAVDGAKVALSQAAQQARATADNFLYLMNTYHLTAMQAQQLAKAAGVSMTQAFGPTQRAQISAYEQAINAARNPLTAVQYDMQQAANSALQLDDRVTALTNAFNALATPFNTTIQDTVTYKQDLATLTQDLTASGNQVGYNTVAQQNSAAAMAAAAKQAMQLSSDILNQTGSTRRALGPIQQMISYLQSLHSNSSLVAQEIRILQQYIDSLHSKEITIGVHFVTTGSQGIGNPTGVAPINPDHYYAAGVRGAAAGWAMVGERGPELVRMRGGEQVIPNHQLAAYANGTGAAGALDIKVYLDGKELTRSTATATYGTNFRNGSRLSGGRPTGILRPR